MHLRLAAFLRIAAELPEVHFLAVTTVRAYGGAAIYDSIIGLYWIIVFL